jgi:uncharacterized membrane-anchored protein
MIVDREDILSNGKEYKFRTAPMDPNDPFRGKYITLDYTNSRLASKKNVKWITNEEIYILLNIDKDGYAIPKSVSREKPRAKTDFVKAKVGYLNDITNELEVEYPFERFYMDENNAQSAEDAYNETRKDSLVDAYALVNIKDGDAVLKDVVIGGVSVKKIVYDKKAKRK